MSNRTKLLGSPESCWSLPNWPYLLAPQPQKDPSSKGRNEEVTSPGSVIFIAMNTHTRARTLPVKQMVKEFPHSTLFTLRLMWLQRSVSSSSPLLLRSIKVGTACTFVSLLSIPSSPLVFHPQVYRSPCRMRQFLEIVVTQHTVRLGFYAIAWSVTTALCHPPADICTTLRPARASISLGLSQSSKSLCPNWPRLLEITQYFWEFIDNLRVTM